ncbi:MAG: lysylphosphatidylglycerol synthase domain-containing protein [Chamaesiphon sp.]
MLKQIWSRLKPYFPLVTLGGTLLFLAKALKEHTSEVAAIKIDAIAWVTLAIALGVTMLAHTWSGWVWTWILRELKQPVNSSQLIQIYLQTNIAKYIPGNFWHYYGRILAAKNAGIAASAATLSVLLEPLLMATAALMIILAASLWARANGPFVEVLPVLGLITVLIAVHPWFLNLAVKFLHRSKATTNRDPAPTCLVKRYPLRPLLGEVGFLGLRSAGFLLTLLAFSPLELSQMPLLLKTFSLAWLLGVIVPGAPGGLGVFEATAVTLLQQHFAPGVLLSAIALYRLVSILAEAACAGLAWVDERR